MRYLAGACLPRVVAPQAGQGHPPLGVRKRPCLHCMIVELIDDFFAEYPATAASDKVD